jgi:hypothetical protein
MVEPNGMADYLAWEPVSAVARCLGVHRRSLSSKPVDFTNREWRDNVSPQWVFYMVREGRRHTAMAGWERRLDEEASWNLTAYVLSVAEK